MIVGAVVVAQLVERSLLIPEVHGSNPVISNFYPIFISCQLNSKDENKEKRDREWPIVCVCVRERERANVREKSMY